jgi:serine/threonine-protein kinase RsbW
MRADVTVTLPAREEFVHILRTLVAGVAARLDFPVDAIDDLRLVVDEACGLLVGLAQGSEMLELKLKPLQGSLELIASLSGGVADRWPPAGPEHALAQQILSALTDECRFEQIDGPAIHLVKSRSGA